MRFLSNVVAMATACTYSSLPANITGVVVADPELCPSHPDTKFCVVDRSCKFIESVGAYKVSKFNIHVNSTKSTWNAIGDLSSLDTYANLVYISIKNYYLENFVVNFEQAKFPTKFEELDMFDIHFVNGIFAANGPIRAKEVIISKSNLVKFQEKGLPRLDKLSLTDTEFSDSNELAKLPSLSFLNIEGNKFTEIANLNFSKMEYLYIKKNELLRSIVNVTLSSKFQTLQLRSSSLEKWVMDETTFKAIDSNLVNLDFYAKKSTNITITTSAADCATNGGSLRELWSPSNHTRENSLKYMVCIVPDRRGNAQTTDSSECPTCTKPTPTSIAPSMITWTSIVLLVTMAMF